MTYLDEAALRSRLARAFSLRRDDVHSLARLPGGRSGITYTAVLGTDASADRIVVKVAPPGRAPIGNRDVLRQAALLRWLAERAAIPVPGVVAVDVGAPPDIPPFFVMRHVEGQSFEPVSDEIVDLPPAEVIHQRAIGASELLAALHLAARDDEPVAGQPVGDAGQEIAKWERAFATIDGPLSDGAAQCAQRLRITAPRPRPAGIIHGDWRLGNMICDGGHVRAVLDWELWAVTDPRLDLAWFLITTVAADNPLARRAVPGLPDPDALVTAYERAGGTASLELPWFLSLARFKGAATMALNLRRAQASASRHFVESRREAVPRLLEVAMSGLS